MKALLLWMVGILMVPVALLSARDGAEIAQSIQIDPKERLSRQWDYVYKRKRLMEKYGIDALPKDEQKILKKWLMANAKGANQARKAGKF